MASSVARKKRLTAAARRAQLIAVGREVYAEKGYEATSVEMLAERAEVSKPILYEHFGGKEGLYAVSVDREIEHVVTLISNAISTGTARQRVEAAALAFLTYVEKEPVGFAVLAHDAPSATRGTAMSSLLNEVAERVSKVFAGLLKEAGYSPKVAPIYAHALVGMVTFVGQWWTDIRKPSVEKVASHIASLVWMGLRHLPEKPDAIDKKSLKIDG